MSEMDAEKARETVAQFGGAGSLLDFDSIHPNAQAYFLAEGYLAALSGPEVKALEQVATEMFDEWKRHYGITKCASESKFEKWQDALAHFRKAVQP